MMNIETASTTIDAAKRIQYPDPIRSIRPSSTSASGISRAIRVEMELLRQWRNMVSHRHPVR